MTATEKGPPAFCRSHALDSMLKGLTSAEVEQQRVAGRTNNVTRTSSRTTANIVKTNLVTRFNVLIVILAGIVAVVGDLIDLTFAFVMVLNAGIGIFQEVRAKRTLDRLTVMVTSDVTVVRDGQRHEVPVADIVLGDCVCLVIGDQVPIDGDVLECDGFEVDESSLTGEADPVAKGVGDEVRSGSAVVAGSASIVATRVGDDAWICKLESQAKEFDPAHSELRNGIDQILRLVSWLIPPLGGLLLWSQLRGGSSTSEGLVSTVAGMIALIPQGLVLLVSVTMATAVVRLAKRQVVVRELPAVEGLARVDVICLDKTGTLTTGRMSVESIESFTPDGADDGDGDGEGEGDGASSGDGDLDGESLLHLGLAALAASETNPTPMFTLVANRVGEPPPWVVESRVMFSSARKWSGVRFIGHGTWIIGAPEVLYARVRPELLSGLEQRIGESTAKARRVLLVVWNDSVFGPDNGLPADLQPMGIVVMSEELRPDAAATMRYFADQGVAVKVISGDSASTVSAVAQKLGILGAERYVDLRSFEGRIADIAESMTVFGRVQPEQKRELVRALQHSGHTVAMTGDGVNDIPALKAADLGIAMDTATPATKAVSELVLLNGRFDLLPDVVAEGRRVITNMERVSSLFVTKTVYAAIFAISAGISGHAYPFLPRHLSLIADLTVGVPAFLLGFRASNERCRPGYLRRVARFSALSGSAVGFVTLAVYGLLRSSLIDASLEESRTGATVALGVCGLWILYRLVRPLDSLETLLIAILGVAFCVMFAVRPLADLYELHLPRPKGFALTMVLIVATLALLQAVLRRFERRPDLLHSGVKKYTPR